MNVIQKAWLKVLAPIIPLVNDKLAKKGGILGRIGKFYAFGPRQFGYHPTSKFIAFANHIYLQSIPLATHKYSFLKFLSSNGFHNQRPWGAASLFGMAMIFGTMVWLAIPNQFFVEEGTSAEILANAKIPTHYSALNDRLSAHYTEINSLYEWEMLKRIDEKVKEIERARNGLKDKTKKTKFARQGYQYIEAHSKTQ